MSVSTWLRIRSVAVDRLAGALLLALAAPLIGVLALLVRATSGRPAFVRLSRVGRHGIRFDMWKLRTMNQPLGATRAGGSPLTDRDDDRVTPLGRFLRRHRLDEFPQLLNVVAGDMAMLGPRPETPEYVVVNKAEWRRVLSVRPGIAGVTQVVVQKWEASQSTANYESVVLPVKLAIDAWYVERATARIDALVVLALVPGRLGRLGQRVLAATARQKVSLMRQASL